MCYERSQRLGKLKLCSRRVRFATKISFSIPKRLRVARDLGQLTAANLVLTSKEEHNRGNQVPLRMNVIGHPAALLRPLEERLQRSVCPLYECDNRRPLVGSAIFLRLGPAVILITAAHVLQPGRGLYIWAQNNEFIGLDGKSYRNEEFDFAFLRLDDELAGELQGYSVLNPEHIDVDDVPASRRLYAFVGFPETKNRPRALTLQRSSTCLLLVPADEQRYCSRGVTFSTHFIANFHRKALRTDTVSEMVVGPDPHGMSGGGVWRIPSARDLLSFRSTERLIGIGIEYHESERAVVGLRMSIIVPAIARAYPEFASELPISKRIRVNVSPP